VALNHEADACRSACVWEATPLLVAAHFEAAPASNLGFLRSIKFQVSSQLANQEGSPGYGKPSPAQSEQLPD
jgi:hypothetical protein